MDKTLEEDEVREVEEDGVEEDPSDIAGISAEPILDIEPVRDHSGAVTDDEDALLELLQPDETGVDSVGSLPVPVHPKGDDEFVCRSCYLVKHRSQLVDPSRQICLDCAA